MNHDLPASYEIDVVAEPALRPGRRALWGAILVGAFVTIATHVTLDLLGAGVGMGLIPRAADITADGTARGFAVGAGIWWLVTTVVAVFVGSLVASRLLQPARRDTAALHGLATWGVATVIWVAAMTTIMGGILGGAVGAMNSSLAVVMARDTANAQAPARAANAPLDAPRPAANRPVVTEEDARQAAKTAAAAALWGFVGLLLSAGAGCLGGIAGCRKMVVVETLQTAPRPAV